MRASVSPVRFHAQRTPPTQKRAPHTVQTRRPWLSRSPDDGAETRTARVRCVGPAKWNSAIEAHRHRAVHNTR